MRKRRTRQSWRTVDAESRYLVTHVWGATQTKPSASNVFCRLNSRGGYIKSSDFEKAEYPYADLNRTDVWSEVHDWCREKFSNAKGRTYSWTGSRFWFQTEADRNTFLAKWSRP